MRRRSLRSLALGLLVLAASQVRAAWVVVDYSDLVERRSLSHSGESVGVLLDRLGGRSVPPAGERPGDRHAHSMLEPLLEPYAFVLSDALDALETAHQPPWSEVGSLWQPGVAQPAWVELLRARRYVIESDGRGTLRAILPWSHDPADASVPQTDSREAARAAWDEAWPVLRHVFEAATRSRRGDEPPPLQVVVHAYRHLPERSEFQLGISAETRTLDDLRGDGRRPPLELGRLRDFLAGGLRLEGGRLDADGRLRLLGSRTDEPPTLLGRSIDLADLAVAYRAVFHGGLNQPYMSLDRGYSPTLSMVSYGGRLRDTSLGWVSLLCDIRFKTFSLGIDIDTGQDLRARLRERVPAFRTHLEAMAAHPDAAGLAGQQTRLWFYPDEVDLTLSPQADVLVLRSVRMSAASERIGVTGLADSDREIPPWTRATVRGINDDYDALAGFFPEMADLDQVVRLLSLFAWLDAADRLGRLAPDLDSLLALDLPPRFTPRTFPQLLAFNALPPPGATAGVAVYDRVPVGEALERLNPSDGRPLPARRRYERAVAALDPTRPEHAALLQELRSYDPTRLAPSEQDLLAQRAERLRLHQTVMTTLDMPDRRKLGQRLRDGEQLRIFSVGIGGLDLGMGPAVARAEGRRLGLLGGGPTAGQGGPASADALPAAEREPREAWRADPPGLPQTTFPDHGLDATTGVQDYGSHRIEVGGERSGESRGWVRTLYDVDGPEVSGRLILLDGEGRAVEFERLERGRLLRYTLAREGDRLVAVRGEAVAAPSAEPTGLGPLPDGLALLHVLPPADGLLESAGVALRLESHVGGRSRNLEAEFPRALLQRLVRGPILDATPGQPLSGLAPLPEPLGPVTSLMVLPDDSRWRAPWDAAAALAAGEEDPLRLARALGEWWAATAGTPGPDERPAAVVGVDPLRSPARWAAAPRPSARALLFLPADGFPEPMTRWPAALAAGWDGARVVDRLPEEPESALVVLVSAEPPATFAARLRRLARDERMRGRLLAAWSLAGPVREDLPRSLLAEGELSGLGLAPPSLVARRHAAKAMVELRQALDRPGTDRRVEQLPGPFLWHF